MAHLLAQPRGGARRRDARRLHPLRRALGARRPPHPPARRPRRRAGARHRLRHRDDLRADAQRPALALAARRRCCSCSSRLPAGRCLPARPARRWLLGALGVAQLAAWLHGDGRLRRSGTTLATATGLGALGRLRLLEPPHTGPNYLLREMVFVVARDHALKLRLLGIALAVLLPFLLLLVASGPATATMAAILHVRRRAHPALAVLRRGRARGWPLLRQAVRHVAWPHRRSPRRRSVKRSTAVAPPGQPPRVQVGALCWRRTGKGVRVMLITSRDTGRWIIPKGWPMRNRTEAEAAAREAWEEAGLRGDILDRSIGVYTYRKVLGPGRCDILCRAGLSARGARDAEAVPRDGPASRQVVRPGKGGAPGRRARARSG